MNEGTDQQISKSNKLDFITFVLYVRKLKLMTVKASGAEIQARLVQSSISFSWCSQMTNSILRISMASMQHDPDHMILLETQWVVPLEPWNAGILGFLLLKYLSQVFSLFLCYIKSYSAIQIGFLFQLKFCHTQLSPFCIVSPLNYLLTENWEEKQQNWRTTGLLLN